MQQKFYLINKKESETPLEALEVFRSKNKIEKQIPMTYAGRLDPLASGLLLLLIGEECKKKEKYLKLDKEYEFEVLFGFKTDTYDILGKVLEIKSQVLSRENVEKEIEKNLKYFKGKIVQKYPLYSSKTVEGKPLFTYARENKAVEIPEREVMIKSLKYVNLRKISSNTLLKNIDTRVNKVNGDFRQKEILKIWKKKLCDQKITNYFFIASFSAKVTSGTYVRTIANDLGDIISIPSLAFSIKRTKIGKWSL